MGVKKFSEIALAGVNITSSDTIMGVTAANADVRWTPAQIVGGSTANPTASVGLTAVNGSATTAMRSDAAPALDQAIAPTWTGLHSWALGTVTTSQPYTFTQTWNNGAVAFTGLKFNATITASASSFLLDLQRGGASQFNVSQFGTTRQAGVIANSAIYTYTDGASAMADTTSARNMALDGASGLRIRRGWYVGWSNGDPAAVTPTTFITGPADATTQLGNANAASPVAQTLQAQGSRAGTDNNVGGANATIQSGNGTGIGTRSTLTLRSPVVVASGTGAQTQTAGLVIDGGTAVSIAYTVAGLPATPLQGARAHVTDATAPAFLGALTGGGAVVCPVFYNGTAWVAG